MDGGLRIAMKARIIKGSMPEMPTRILKEPILKQGAILEELQVLFQFDAANFRELKFGTLTATRTLYIYVVGHWVPFVCSGHNSSILQGELDIFRSEIERVMLD